jgi:hypothetical protein
MERHEQDTTDDSKKLKPFEYRIVSETFFHAAKYAGTLNTKGGEDLQGLVKEYGPEAAERYGKYLGSAMAACAVLIRYHVVGRVDLYAYEDLSDWINQQLKMLRFEALPQTQASAIYLPAAELAVEVQKMIRLDV